MKEKIKRISMSVFFAGLLMLVLAPATAFAKPKWFRNGPIWPWVSAKELHTTPWSPEEKVLATDPLLVVSSLELPPLPPETPPPPEGRSLGYEVGGWVTFECETQEGFVYSIDVKGLDPDTMYDIVAFDVFSLTIVDLGDILTDGDGEGEIEGIIGLDPGFYVYAISVNLDGTPILQTLPPNTFYDPALDDFIIPTPFGDMPLGVLAWTFGDSADFAVFP